MPQLRVFLSSTAYDLGLVRGQLSSFIGSLGHQPVLSDHAGVLFDPAKHTQESCVQELLTCDAVVLVVGSRWGSEARPEFVEALDTTTLDDSAGRLSEMLEGKRLSVTQLEALTALSQGIPMFVFVESKVASEARLYEANRELADQGLIAFPSMQDPETARYVFQFLDYVQSRSSGNAVMEFNQLEEIQFQLRTQWSALFQSFVSTERKDKGEKDLLTALVERIEDVKTVILASIESPDAKSVATGVIRFRTLAAAVDGLRVPRDALTADVPPTWAELLHGSGVESELGISGSRSALGRWSFALVRQDELLVGRQPLQAWHRLESEWENFRELPPDERKLVLDALSDRRTIAPYFKSYVLTRRQFEQLVGLAEIDNQALELLLEGGETEPRSRPDPTFEL